MISKFDRMRRRFVGAGAGTLAALGFGAMGRTASAARPQAIIGMSHLGICVSDLERATGFYKEVLGAEELTLYKLDEVMPANYRDWMGIPADLACESKFLAIDGFLLELLYYTRNGKSAGNPGPSERRAMHQPGFTHLSLRIADVGQFKDTLAKVDRFGGHHIENGYLLAEYFEGEPVELSFVTDPDGTRIELMRIPRNYPMGGTVYHPRSIEHSK